jgi:hypothetical protein
MRRHSRARRRKSTKTRRRQRGGSKCLFINWGQGIGLGNQLFIYAAALIMKNHLKKWNLCIPPVEKNPHTSTDYRFLFKQGTPVEKTKETVKRLAEATVIHKDKNIRNGEWTAAELAKDSGTDFSDPSKNLRLKTSEYPEEGLYHNYESIAPAIPIVRKELQEELNARYTPSVENPDSTAFLHVRYGDYETHKMVGPIEYYKAAKAKLQALPSIKTIYVISDAKGIQWAASEGLTEGTTTIDDPDELKVLHIMSQCKAGACISASTYSIWGAILGPQTNPNATIIYPSTWVHLKGKDLSFPTTWVEI